MRLVVVPNACFFILPGLLSLSTCKITIKNSLCYREEKAWSNFRPGSYQDANGQIRQQPNDTKGAIADAVAFLSDDLAGGAVGVTKDIDARTRWG